MRKLFPANAYSAFRYPEFRFFVTARFLLTVSWQIQAIVFGWFIYSFTKDPLSLGLIGLAEAIPSITVALFGGYLADKYDRKKLIIIFLLLFLITSASLTFFTYDGMANLNKYGTFPVYALIFMTGVVRGVLGPTSVAFSAQLIPKTEYANASAWSSSVWQLGAVTGPALGGLVYGYGNAYYASLMAFVIGTITLLCYTKINSKPLPNIISGLPLMEKLTSGIRFVWNNKVMLTAITLDLFAVLFGGAVALLPMFADQILGTGAEGLGMLRAAPALGAVFMAVILAYRPPIHNAGNKLLLAVSAFGVCMILFALSTNFILSLFLLALAGMFDNVSVVIRATIMQALTPDDMRGRVSAVNTIFIGSSNEIGAFESGVTARIFGLIPSVVIGGCMTLVVVGMSYKLAPSLRKMNLAKELTSP